MTEICQRTCLTSGAVNAEQLTADLRAASDQLAARTAKCDQLQRAAGKAKRQLAAWRDQLQREIDEVVQQLRRELAADQLATKTAERVAP